MNRLYYVLIATFFVCYLHAKELKQNQPLDLSGTWQIALDSADLGLNEKWYNKQFGQTISLPGTTDVAGLGIPNTLKPALEKPQVLFLTRKNKYIGAAWYTRDIEIPKNWKNKMLQLKLERVLWESRLWVNGVEVEAVQESLVAPHYFDISDFVKVGKNKISIRIDNRKKYDISYAGANSPLGLAHAYTEDTQTIWNGIIGEMTCTASDRVRVSDFQLYPDVDKKNVRMVVKIEKKDTKPFKGKLKLQVKSANESLALPVVETKLKFKEKHTTIEVVYAMGENVKLWSEFQPHIYRAQASIEAKAVKYSTERSFGMRKLTNRNTAFQMNDANIFLRGTLECSIFPLTGHPPMKNKAWAKIFSTAREWGLNHIRFHSWCPPKAAFEVADSMGFYLQVELPLWSLTINKDSATNEFLYAEADRMIREYGNHPSFCFWSIGNELQPDFKFLNAFVDKLKSLDSRHLYTNTSYTFEKGHGVWPEPNDDFYISQKTKKGWVRGQGIFGTDSPVFNKNYSEATEGLKVPLVTHEIGQYSVYPPMSEIAKYTGVLDPLNFKGIKADLEKRNLIDKAPEYTMASGKLAAVLYKEEIERAYKTERISGFQLLDLHDFPGQGTALVGLLDVFWESKGLITAEKFREFCAPVVPLAQFAKPIYKSNETCEVMAEIANYSGKTINGKTKWELLSTDGVVLQHGELAATSIENGKNTKTGKFKLNFSAITKASQLEMRISIEGTPYSNSWKLWVYPADIKTEYGKVIYTRSYAEAQKALNEGKTVLYNPDWRKLNGIEGKFLPVFWSPVHFPKQAATMGTLCNPAHPALAHFPTDMHSDWQWWDLNTKSKTIVLDSIPPVTPIVEMVDNWMNNRRLALVFEAKCGAGKLIYSTIDLQTDIENRPQAKQMLYSLLRYMNSDAFSPVNKLNSADLQVFESEIFSDKKENALDIY